MPLAEARQIANRHCTHCSAFSQECLQCAARLVSRWGSLEAADLATLPGGLTGPQAGCRTSSCSFYRAADSLWLQRQSGGVCCCCAELHQSEGRKSWVAGKKCKWRWRDCKLTLKGATFTFPVLLHSHRNRDKALHPLWGRRVCVREQESTPSSPDVRHHTHSGSWVPASKSTWHLSPSICLPGLILIPARN